MIRSLCLQAAALFIAFSRCALLPAADELRAIDIGSRLELFVDHHLLDRLDGARVVMHRPQPQPPAHSPLRGSYATVIRDGDLFRAWYRDTIPGYEGVRGDGHPGEITAYAESRDGHEWIFPDLGLFEINGSRDNNAVLAGRPPFSHNFSPFLDARPGVAAEQRFKALAGARQDVMDRCTPAGERRTGGLYAFVSPDGIRWTLLQPEPVITDGRFDSQNVAFWSEAEAAYVCYFRTLTDDKRRAISRATSRDFITWTPAEALNANLPGEHLYTSQTHPYFRAPHLYLALPTRFVPARGNSTDILLMASRGGAPFVRLFHEAFIRPGLDPERWGNRANYAALNVVPTGPAEMSVYHTHSGIRHTLRTDGFTSLNAPHDGGEAVTKPLVFSGNRLVLNLATSASGSVRVELQTPAGEPITGFGLADSEENIGDEIERTARWKQGDDVSRLAGQPVRLRFVLQDADLFSFRFAE